jgi:uncharacterized RDD family membrane protein YckC
MAEEAENSDTPADLPGNDTDRGPEMQPESDAILAEGPPGRIGFGKRLGAYVLDAIFTVITAGVLAYALKDLFVAIVPADPDIPSEAGAWLAAFSGASGLCAVFYGLIEGFTGASPGKMILAIKIGTQNSTSARPKMLLTRYALKTSSSIFTVLGLFLSVEFLNTVGTIAGIIVLIGCFFALGASKQALHDKIARTAVFPEETIP